MIAKTISSTATDLRRNDEIGGFGVIESTAVGTKYVTVRSTSGATRKCPKDSIVVFTRMVNTPEEDRAERMAMVLRCIQHIMLVDSPRAQIEEALQRSRDYDLLDWSNLQNILQQQAKFKVVTHIREVTDRFLKAGVPVDYAMAAAFQEVTAHRDTYIQNPLSRSTSVLSNILSDLEEWAYRYTRERIWSMDGTDEMLEEILAMAKDKVRLAQAAA